MKLKISISRTVIDWRYVSKVAIVWLALSGLNLIVQGWKIGLALSAIIGFILVLNILAARYFRP